MANTKKLSRQDRKRTKRAARRELGKVNIGLGVKQRREFRKSEKGLKAFLAEKEKQTAE